MLEMISFMTSLSAPDRLLSSTAEDRPRFRSAALNFFCFIGVGTCSRNVASPPFLMAVSVILRMTLFLTPAFTMATMLLITLSTGWTMSRPLPFARLMVLFWFA